MNENNRLRIIRWSARSFAGLMAAFVLFIFVGNALTDGVGSLLRLTLRESVMMVAFVAVWVGLLLGWKWELAGGLLTVCGMVAFYLLDYAFSGTFPGGLFFLIIAVPGVLFIVCAVLGKRGMDGEGA